MPSSTSSSPSSRGRAARQSSGCSTTCTTSGEHRRPGRRGAYAASALTRETEIRAATDAELELLPALEQRADALLATVGIALDAPVATIDELRQARLVLVAGRPPLGFARIDLHGDTAHLEQLSVDPSTGRRGLGARLLEAACAWAAGAGYPQITLMTFRDVPFNGPFYAAHGFVEIEPPAELAAVVAEDRRLGLHRLGARVVMRRAFEAP